eukprot:3019677-Rhodomonas_salina.2
METTCWQFWYWESVEMLRKLTLASMIPMLVQTPANQVTAPCCSCVVVAPIRVLHRTLKRPCVQSVRRARGIALPLQNLHGFSSAESASRK